MFCFILSNSGLQAGGISSYLPTLNLHLILKKGFFIDVAVVQNYKMREALKLFYKYIYAKLDGCVL